MPSAPSFASLHPHPTRTRACSEGIEPMWPRPSLTRRLGAGTALCDARPRRKPRQVGAHFCCWARPTPPCLSRSPHCGSPLLPISLRYHVAHPAYVRHVRPACVYGKLTDALLRWPIPQASDKVNSNAANTAANMAKGAVRLLPFGGVLSGLINAGQQVRFRSRWRCIRAARAPFPPNPSHIRMPPERGSYHVPAPVHRPLCGPLGHSWSWRTLFQSADRSIANLFRWPTAG